MAATTAAATFARNFAIGVSSFRGTCLQPLYSACSNPARSVRRSAFPHALPMRNSRPPSTPGPISPAEQAHESPHNPGPRPDQPPALARADPKAAIRRRPVCGIAAKLVVQIMDIATGFKRGISAKEGIDLGNTPRAAITDQDQFVLVNTLGCCVGDDFL